MSKTQTVLPIISEKAMRLAEMKNTYAFSVPTDFNKLQVKDYVSQKYDVDVKKVNILNQRGKVKSSLIRGGRQRILGKRSDTKKAYVTLEDGDSIKLFEEGDE